ncbi:MAG TPA: hypothetical protein VHG30_00065, partial [Microvirga sp.]|nr:hypothetical protein [Microvirga sp.]
MLLFLFLMGSVGIAYLEYLLEKWMPLCPRTHVLLSDPSAKAYRYDDNMTFVFWQDRWFNIIRDGPLVVRMGQRHRRFRGVTWWPRGWFQGPIVGMAIKDDEENC